MVEWMNRSGVIYKYRIVFEANEILFMILLHMIIFNEESI